MSATILSNSLAVLGARIRAEHRATSDALKSSVEHAIAAGALLLEAKALVPHGQWLPWLTENCEISERTAQLYMRTAKNREAIELQIRNGVADLSLNEAAALLFLTSDIKKLFAFTQRASEITDPEKLVAFCVENDVGVIRDSSYSMWAGTSDEQKREWTLFVLLLATSGGSAEGAALHVEWIRQRPFTSVDEWLGEEGQNFRKCCGLRNGDSEAQISSWRSFLALNVGRSQAEIEAELVAADDSHAPAVRGFQRKKSSRKRASTWAPPS